MPEGLVNRLTLEQVADLFAYLMKSPEPNVAGRNSAQSAVSCGVPVTWIAGANAANCPEKRLGCAGWTGINHLTGIVGRSNL